MKEHYDLIIIDAAAEGFYALACWRAGVLACWRAGDDMVPDPNFMLTCMHQAWDELLAAADALYPKQPIKLLDSLVQRPSNLSL